MSAIQRSNVTKSNGTSDIAAPTASLIASRRPAHSLPQPFYIDAQIYERDIERVVLKQWLYAGHVSQIPKFGDYFLCEIAGESIIVVRGRDEKIHALFNVCRHRGSRVCLEKEGNANAFKCPYHAWMYGLDGNLLAARHMGEGFDKAQFGLEKCAVEVLEGLIFVCLDKEPPDFAPMRSDLEPFLKMYGLERTKICHRKINEVQCNWKLLMENYFECYHCTTAHPEFASVNSHVKAQDSKRLAARDKVFHAQWQQRVLASGQPIGKIALTPDTCHYCGRDPIAPGFVTQTSDGKPAAPLLGAFKDYDGGVTGVTLFLFSLVATNDYVTLIRFVPKTPTTTESEVVWLVREDAEEGRDYDVGRIVWLWGNTFEQDYKICEDNQKGINSRRYQPGPYSQVEGLVDTFVQWYLKRVA